MIPHLSEQNITVASVSASRGQTSSPFKDRPVRMEIPDQSTDAASGSDPRISGTRPWILHCPLLFSDPLVRASADRRRCDCGEHMGSTAGPRGTPAEDESNVRVVVIHSLMLKASNVSYSSKWPASETCPPAVETAQWGLDYLDSSVVQFTQCN